MNNSQLMEAEAKLQADRDGSYKTQLIQTLAKYRDKFTSSKQGLLPPDEYEAAEHVERALNAALEVVLHYKPVKSQTA
jgi:hypothetical protein